MFTGIVQGLCEVASVADQPGLRRTRIQIGDLAQGLALGGSVAVNGVCLTATGVEAGSACFDVVRETLDHTNLGALAPGSRVNVERSFRVGDEIGGHILSGHVVGTALVDAIEQGENERNLWLRVEADWLRFLQHKGFAALDGASLTIAAVEASARRIKVSLIPETIARTTLGSLAQGDRVNLEIDSQTRAIVETVERMLKERGTPL
ncbi:MAG: riboflavin synthase subunit alpha [Gammaproteobacteria bacterium]|nr:riboflavin synthase subunit alpha [Gammaproteobacteria bacterium]